MALQIIFQTEVNIVIDKHNGSTLQHWLQDPFKITKLGILHLKGTTSLPADF